MGVWGEVGQDIGRIWGVAKTFALEDPRALKMRNYVTSQATKISPHIQTANAMGRDAFFTAKRTIGAADWSGKGLGYHAMVGVGIGGALGAANAYGQGRDPMRGGIRGAFMGAGAGLGVGVGKSLYKGYGTQAASRLRGYGASAGPLMGANPMSRARRAGRAAGSFIGDTRTGRM